MTRERSVDVNMEVIQVLVLFLAAAVAAAESHEDNVEVVIEETETVDEAEAAPETRQAKHLWPPFYIQQHHPHHLGGLQPLLPPHLLIQKQPPRVLSASSLLSKYTTTKELGKAWFTCF